MFSLVGRLRLPEVGASRGGLRSRLPIFGRIAHVSDVELNLRALQLRRGKAQFGARGIDLRAVFARIDFDEQVAPVNIDVVVDRQLHDIARDLRGNRNRIAVGVGVVRAFLVARHEPPDESDDGKQHDHDGQHDQRLLAVRLAILGSIAVVAAGLVRAARASIVGSIAARFVA